ncbi:TPA: ribosome small subunit-dependent GTPase A [Patescibacteria group bacterium]|nr:ribosome small subunit-dependent GTPase A [Patescibacteria group bacterium]
MFSQVCFKPCFNYFLCYTYLMENLGYNEFFKSAFETLQAVGCSPARVTAEHKGAYKVKNATGEFLAKVTGKQMFTATSREDYPAVGDWVAIQELDQENATIHAVLPRKTILKRKYNNKNDSQLIATNIDIAFIVASVDRDFNLNRFERYIALAHDGGVQSTIIVNKIDLLSKDELDSKIAHLQERFPDITVLTTSTVRKDGLQELAEYMEKEKTYCFLGSSGVGKSSLINSLLGENALETGEISFQTGRGKHVTTGREMYFLKNGGIVVDNPGMREVGMTDTNAGVDTLFDEIVTLAEKCKYPDCTHTHESGCNVAPHIQSGRIDEDKFSNYVRLKKEADFYEMSEYEKRNKDKKFGKFLKKAKKTMGECGYDAYQ